MGISQYPKNAFSVDNSDTISVIQGAYDSFKSSNPEALSRLGQRTALSAMDATGIKTAYSVCSGFPDLPAAEITGTYQWLTHPWGPLTVDRIGCINRRARVVVCVTGIAGSYKNGCAADSSCASSLKPAASENSLLFLEPFQMMTYNH